MASATTSPPQAAARVDDVALAAELHDSFCSYAYSVITARALPDARDGLKPVQRRIIYSMLRSGARPGGAFRKSARVVGDVMGRYHPHGDAAIYDALVRLGQDFSRMVPMVDPQGNFGSLDDPPAASRYTECRLAAAAMTMCGGIDEGTVDFVGSYDGDGSEPAVLPAGLPLLLVNGASGIAVGMATNLPPHNPSEAAAAVKLVLAAPDKQHTADDLMAVMPGPDFPTGGLIVSSPEEIAEAYRAGRGSIEMRARVSVVHERRGRTALEATELPYGIGPESVVGRCQELIASSKLPGVARVADLSDLGGTRIRFDLAKNADPAAALADLYRLTSLQTRFAVSSVVLDGAGRPVAAPLVDLCRMWCAHRVEVVERRTRHRLDAAAARLHLVEGLLKALAMIRRVVEIIAASSDAADAKAALTGHRSLRLTDRQAEHLLDLPLRRLTSMSAEKLRSEDGTLRSEIADCEALLASPDALRARIAEELDTATEAVARPRRSVIYGAGPAADAAPAPDNDGPSFVAVTPTGHLFAAARRPRRAARWTEVPPGGYAAALLPDGTVHVVRPAGLPSRAPRGAPKPAPVALVASSGDGGPLMAVTASGSVKRLSAEAVADARDGDTYLPVADGDRVVAVFAAPDDAEAVCVSSGCKALRFPAAAVPQRGAAAGAVAGMALGGGETILAAGPADGTCVAVLTSDGRAKCVPAADVPLKRTRTAAGVNLGRPQPENARAVAAAVSTGTVTAAAADGSPLAELEPTSRSAVYPAAPDGAAALA